MATKNGGKGQQQSPPAPAQQQERQKPAHEVRFGRVKLTIWENHHEKTGRWFSIVPSRSYKDGSGNWKSASSFGLDDVLPLALACQVAFEWIQAQKTSGANGATVETENGGEEPIPF